MSRQNIDFKAIADRIKSVRKELKLSQEMFGKAIDFRRQDIHAIETGKRQPGLTVLYRMAITYELSLDWLVTGIGDKNLK